MPQQKSNKDFSTLDQDPNKIPTKREREDTYGSDNLIISHIKIAQSQV
jgi:hypothetical protein